MLRTAVRGLLGDGDGVITTPDPRWRARWPALAEMGLTGFCVSEDRGGFGLRVDAAVAAATELGAALHGAPFASLTAAAHAVATAADPETEVLLADLLAGERICSYGRLDADGGTARLVDGVPGADALVADDPRSGELRLVADPTAWTVDTSPYAFDVGRRCADVAFAPTGAHRLPTSPTARSVRGLLLAADTLGGLQSVLDRTVAYANQRHAFGRPIGGFQAVQHRLADHAVRARGMALLVDEAARSLTAHDPTASRAVGLAELSVHGSATHILHDLLQLTGAIGFTWEYGLHYFQRRAHHNARLAGGPRAAARSLADAEGWSRAG